MDGWYIFNCISIIKEDINMSIFEKLLPNTLSDILVRGMVNMIETSIVDNTEHKITGFNIDAKILDKQERDLAVKEFSAALAELFHIFMADISLKQNMYDGHFNLFIRKTGQFIDDVFSGKHMFSKYIPEIDTAEHFFSDRDRLDNDYYIIIGVTRTRRKSSFGVSRLRIYPTVLLMRKTPDGRFANITSSVSS